MQSGTTGINTVRIYNPIKQGHDQDPDGNFTRKWVPELAALPDDALQEPWKHEAGRSLLGTRYPAPIVDVAAAARAAREAIYGVRKSHAFRQEANSIQDKHGSRKSGMPITGQRRKPARKASQPSPDQLPLDL